MERGSDEYNMALADARSKQTIEYLANMTFWRPFANHSLARSIRFAAIRGGLLAKIAAPI